MCRYRFVSLVVCLILSAGLMCGCDLSAFEAGHTYEIYVSTDGDDASEGTRDSPLQTISAAKEKLKGLKKTIHDNDIVRVYLRGGVYPLSETLVFSQEDLPNATYCRYKNEEVVISGSFAISGFAEENVNGIRMFTKQLDDSAQSTDFKSLYCNGEQLKVPRYPNEGYLHVKDISPEDDLWTEENTPWTLTRGQRAFYADSDDLPAEFRNPKDVQVRILHYWHDELMMLTRIDYETGKLNLSRPSTMLIREDDKYYFENVFEALDEPGEWYRDSEENKIYYIPKDGETAENLRLYASSTNQLVRIDGVDGIKFEGIRFTETDWEIPTPGDWPAEWRKEANLDALQAAVDVKGVAEVKNARNVSFKNCEFINIGSSGIKLLEGTRDSEVDSCIFRNIAATGVFVGGENCTVRDYAYTANISVKNNIIDGYGRKFFCAIGIQITFCDGADIANNEISDGYYTAISNGWVWDYTYNLTKDIKITDNLIYNIGQGWLSDMGGIYTLGVQPGTVISGNVIHNIAADSSEGGYGGWGIYLDEGSSDILVEKNLVYACGSDSYHLHHGKDNVVRNNIFALSKNSQIRVSSKYLDFKTADFLRNIILTNMGIPAVSYMQNKDVFTSKGNILWDLSMKSDVLVQENAETEPISIKEANEKGFLEKDIVENPNFYAPESFDFSFINPSYLQERDFELWDYSNAGTINRTTVGLSSAGGETEYNYEAESVQE